MRRGTTVWLSLTVEAIDLRDDWVEVALSQRGKKLIVLDDDALEKELEGEDTVLTARLSQEDTLSLSAGEKCQVQVRFITREGEAGASVIETLPVWDILREGVIGYGKQET